MLLFSLKLVHYIHLLYLVLSKHLMMIRHEMMISVGIDLILRRLVHSKVGTLIILVLGLIVNVLGEMRCVGVLLMRDYGFMILSGWDRNWFRLDEWIIKVHDHLMHRWFRRFIILITGLLVLIATSQVLSRRFDGFIDEDLLIDISG